MLGLALLAAACKENKAATEKCKAAEKAEACELCCKDNGAPNYAFVSGGSCLCRD